MGLRGRAGREVGDRQLRCLGIRARWGGPLRRGKGAEREPGEDGETNTASGAPGDTDPGTETSTRYKSENEAEERIQRGVGSSDPRRPTPDQVPLALGGCSASACGRTVGRLWDRANPFRLFGNFSFRKTPF